MYKLLSVVLLFVIVHANHELYDGSSLYEVKTHGIEQLKLLAQLEREFRLDVWIQAEESQPGQILVSKTQRGEFQRILSENEIKFNVLVENIKEHLDLEDKLFALHTKSKTYNRNVEEGLSFDTIHTYEEVNAYLDDLGAAYPDIVEVVLAGQTNEGRDLKYLKISSTKFEDTSKPVIYMESLLHSREWITLPVTLYAIQQLVIERTDSDLLDKVDWIIMPIANPDGFAATKAGERLWRKNRSKGFMIGDLCYGVDLNRNFDIMWSEHSSSIPCMETFHGTGPNSEPEARVVTNIIHENIDRLKLYLDIHSFSSLILYGYGNGTLPSNALNLNLVAVGMATAIDAVKTNFNKNYIVGNTAHVLYEASGSSQDYAQSVGVPLAYTYELPAFWGLGQTALGFLVDPAFIPQVGFETWEGIKVGARYVIDNY